MVGKGLDFLVFAYTIIRCCDHGHISESDARLFLQLFHVPRTLTVHSYRGLHMHSVCSGNSIF